MQLAAVDDSSQLHPSRPGIIGGVVGGGCVLLDIDAAPVLERQIDEICLEYGFPPGEKFKWSPGRELWMYNNLTGDARRDFYQGVLQLLEDASCKILVAIEDAGYRSATGCEAADRDLDAIRLLIRQLVHWLSSVGESAILTMDLPGGGFARQKEFVLSCAAMGASCKRGEHGLFLPPIPLAASSVRLLQAADLVTSCAVALVSGELNYAPPIFRAMLPMIVTSADDRRGATGFVLHPQSLYSNLYYWLLDDAVFRRGPLSVDLPVARWRYSNDDWSP